MSVDSTDTNGAKNAEPANSTHFPGKGSTGPKTPEGKSKSSQNSTKWGFYSERIVLANESQAMFDDLRASYIQEWAPVGQTENDLVTRLVVNQWRILRCMGIEAGMLNAEMFIQKKAFDSSFDNPNAQLRQGDAFLSMSGDSAAAVQSLAQWETRFTRAYERTARLLIMLQRNRKAAGTAQPVEQKTANPENEVPAPPQPRVPHTLNPCETRQIVTTGGLSESFEYESAFNLTELRNSIYRKEWKV